ncbi:Digeranylgeranylglyceryl phosphate synthase [uncultured archaeon]|nr:Digeranylgeranylglyceryl phosphate synthase [uncultured archaeon]
MEQKTKSKKEFFLTRPVRFLIHWRPFPPYELICYILMFAGATMFSWATIFPNGILLFSIEIIKPIILTIATLYSGFFAALIWNDITDKDIDIVVHPTRAIPSGHISSKKFFTIALVFSALTFLFAVLTSPWCLLIVGLTALFVAFHNKYLKKIIKLPAYSEIFTPVQWLAVPLFGFFAIFTTLPAKGDINFSVPVLGNLSIYSIQLIPMFLLCLFTYFADDAHDIAEGIHDVDGDRRLGVKTYATSFGERNAVKISFSMLLISGILGILLWFFSFLSLIFLIPFIVLWFYTLNQSYQFIKMTDDLQRKRMGKIMGKKIYDYLLFSFSLIFLDVFLQLINAEYLHWINSII